ncbi:hypothetical protein P879_07015 [Paragonimus westermani]|uniref:LIM zinc-binding domain-containing protein n=1 Tax=Paragonimus westermani TaxID=34504 RepID=A0A8T0D828_9TREM|nr:hypothetical protein P879_07015 [Paragonimus westermani]
MDTQCFVCQKRVYAFEAFLVLGRIYHKSCFRCHKCHRILSVSHFMVGEKNPYCESHFMELFRARGRYDGPIGGRSVDEYDDLLIRQNAVQSGAPAESDKERPPPSVTRNLVALFQQMSSQNSVGSQNHHEITGDSRRPAGLNRVHAGAHHSKPSCGFRTTTPTPFQQAFALQRRSSQPETVGYSPERQGSSQQSDSALHPKSEELPHPGITRNLVAKFATLYPD